MAHERKTKHSYKKTHKTIQAALVKDNENIVAKMVVNMKRVEIPFFFPADVPSLIIISATLLQVPLWALGLSPRIWHII